MRRIKRNDEVVVIAGRDKGKRGDVLSVRSDGRALVSGVNLVKKHMRPDPHQGIRGGIVEQEAPIALSNVALWNDNAGKGDRVGFRFEDGRKVRYFKSTNETVDS